MFDMAKRRYRTRLVDSRLQELFSELPAVMLTGPRATGKTTSAIRFADSVVRLDDPAQAVAFSDNPDSALSAYAEPLLIDEWQIVPDVLGAIKRAVDSDPRPGRFLLTGSARARLTTPTWPGTGRVVEIHMEGLTQRELSGSVDGPGFLDRLAASDLTRFPGQPNPPGLPQYLEAALKGGFPEAALAELPSTAFAWLDGYVEQLLTRDLDLLDESRDPEKLRRYLEAACLNTAGTPDQSTLYEAAGINHATAKAYERLLFNLYALDTLPAWWSNRLKRLTAVAKLLVVDPALAGAVLGLDLKAVIRDGDMTGRLLETFAIAQIRAETALTTRGFRLHHLRDKGGEHEIDLVAEGPGGEVIAIEVKATSAPSKRHARNLIWLRKQLGDKFIAGAILHTGPLPFQLDDRIFALPQYSIWKAE